MRAILSCSMDRIPGLSNVKAGAIVFDICVLSNSQESLLSSPLLCVEFLRPLVVNTLIAK